MCLSRSRDKYPYTGMLQNTQATFLTVTQEGSIEVHIVLCFSLRLGLLHEAKEMRAACLRALRYYISDVEAVHAFLRLNMDYLVAR